MAGIPRRLMLAAAAASFIATGLAACDRGASGGSGSKASFKSVDITGADYAQQLDLPDVDGKRRSLADFKGKVTLVFFGYTQCPDVCPTTMLELQQVKKELGPDGSRLQGVFVTLDPERDTPEVLKAYIANFGPDITGLRGTPDETRAAAKSFKVFYNKVPGKTETSYTLDHTAGAYVFDAQGRVRLFTRYGSGPEVLKADVKQLLAEAAG